MDTQTILYIAGAFAGGFIIAWVLKSLSMARQQKVLKSTSGLLESEKLKRETLRNENEMVHRQKQTLELELGKRLEDAYAKIKQMDADILLLQQSNEETEELLRAGQPEIHDLKLKLIEANNTIARYKGAVK